MRTIIIKIQDMDEDYMRCEVDYGYRFKKTSSDKENKAADVLEVAIQGLLKHIMPEIIGEIIGDLKGNDADKLQEDANIMLKVHRDIRKAGDD